MSNSTTPAMVALWRVVAAVWPLVQVSSYALPRPRRSAVVPHRAAARGAAALRTAAVPAGGGDAKPSVALICGTAALQSACFGCIGTALPPALRASGLAPARVALVLGRIGSASALAEVLLSGTFGRLADAVGRKPILLGAPAACVVARSAVVFCPDVRVLVAARLASAFAVPIYWLAFQASLADSYGGDATELAVVSSRVSAAMGLGYAIASLAGGALAPNGCIYFAPFNARQVLRVCA